MNARAGTRAVIIVFLLTVGGAVAQQPSASATPTNQEQPKTSSRPPLRPATDSRRFVFTLIESDHGKKVNSRTFEMLSREHEPSFMKTGSRIPVATASSSANAAVPPSIQYIDVGLNARVQYYLREDGRLDLSVSFDMSTIAPLSDGRQSLTPVVRQTTSSIAAAITPDTPTVLDNIEDLNSGHTYELSVIAKPR